MLLDYFRLIFNVKKCNVDSLKTKTSICGRGFYEFATDSDHDETDHYHKKCFFYLKEKSHLYENFFQWRLSINLLWSRKMVAAKLLNLFKKDRILRFFSLSQYFPLKRIKHNITNIIRRFTINNLVEVNHV